MDYLGGLIEQNRGFLIRAQALALGETDKSIRSAIRAGVLVRLRHGAFARTVDVAGSSAEQLHLLRARAAVAQQKGPVALAGPSATLRYGYDVFRHDLDLVHLIRLDGGSSRHQAGLVHHRCSAAVASRVRVVDGVPTVSPEDAVWQTALLSTLEGGVVTIDSALHQHPELALPLRALAAEEMTRPGSRTARLALRMSRAESESAGESLTRVACFRHGIPCPDLQHRVFDDSGRLVARTDFWWEAFRHAGEFDGKVKYKQLLKPDEDPSDVVVDEKRREDTVRSVENCGMSRFTWADVLPELAARRMARLRDELERSHRLYVRAPA